MIDLLARNWRWVALRGGVALVFGLLTLFKPEITLAALIFLFAGYAIADGMFGIISAIANRRGQPHWVALLVGAYASLIGILLIALGFRLRGWSRGPLSGAAATRA